MTANSIVRARIDEQTKNEAAAVLKAMGLTVSDAFRLMMVRIAKEKALPFEPLVPNEETIEAMKAARRGELTTVGPPRKLIASLNEDCSVYQPFSPRLQARQIRAARQAPRCRAAPNRYHAGEGRAVAAAAFRSPARRRVERSPRLPHPTRPHPDLPQAGRCEP
jgi:DNA-damage-inducible protein J